VTTALDTMDIDGPPRRMGRYELLFRIASGGMAEVYAARAVGEAGFQKLVAVKRMLPTLAEDPEFVQMFLDEARVAANISNAHVVQTLDLGRDSTGALYIVMDLVVGVTLSRILKEAAKVRRAVPVGMGVELLAQTAAGLHAAHEATTPVGEPLHIVHRDVSPQNILVGIDGRVRITDFGVARAVARATQTQAGRIKGKFAYCAPEQLIGRDMDRRADVFALGVVAWETLAGQRLFVADHPMAIMDRVQNMPILPVHQVRNRVPEAVAMVIDKALQRPRDQRWDSAGEFGAALRDAARSSGVELPEQAARRRFVQGAGGDPLRKIRENISVALSGSPAELDEEPETLSGISATSGTMDTHMERVGVDLSGPEPDASAIHGGPGSLMPPAPVSPMSQAKRPPAWAFALGGLALGILVAVGLVLALREDPAPTPVATPAEATPTPTDAANEAAANGAAADEATATGEAATNEATATGEAAPTEPTATGETETREADPAGDEAEASAANETDEDSASARPATPRTRPRRTSTATTAMAAPEPTPAPTPDPAPTSMMRSLLLGLDDFDRASGE